jgi:hypothetical protein
VKKQLLVSLLSLAVLSAYAQGIPVIDETAPTAVVPLKGSISIPAQKPTAIKIRSEIAVPGAVPQQATPAVAYSSDRGQRFHSDGGHRSALMADSFSHTLMPLSSMS